MPAIIILTNFRSRIDITKERFMTAASSSVLTQALLERCRQRAPGYDRDNTFCLEDFNELKAAGYLKMAVPKEFGGPGMTLAQVARETRLLAQYAPPTALCINMHNYWVGNAADLWRGSDKSCEWILKDAAAGEVFAAGHAGADMFVAGFFTWALVNFANVYYGIGLRTREVLIEQLKTKTSIALTRPMIYHPEVQHGIAEITMDLETMGPHVEAIAADWSEGRIGPDWLMRLFAVKHRTVEAAFRIVDRALDLSGGFGMFKKSELERLFRDCRAGRFHPANSLLTHELVGKISLGINPDEQPRWG